MKNAFEKMKDFLYDYIDYVLILLVVVIIGGIIGWRLEILFNDNETEAIEKDIDEKDIDENSSKEKKKDSNNDKEQQKDSDKDSKDEKNKDDEDNKEIVIKIPDGSLPSDIAKILLDNGLIDDTDKFLDRAEDLELETKLRADEFKLNKEYDLDTIIKILSKKIDDDEISSKKKKEDSNNDKEQEKDSDEDNKEIVIKIPDGSLPSDIAKILLDNGLIDDTDKFLDRAEDLELETKLRADEFKLNKGANLDTIIKVLARVK